MQQRCARTPAAAAATAALHASPAQWRSRAPPPASALRRPCRSAGRLCALRVTAGGWGAPVTWHEARVGSSEAAAEGLRSVFVKVPDAVAAGYTVPGQYVQVKVADADKPAFIAIASPVSAQPSGVLELLIKRTSATEALCDLPAGAPLQVSPVQGRGFQLAALSPAASFPDVVIFATGSGISPIRALLETPAALGGLAPAQRGRVRLFYGARSAAHMAFASRLKEWEKAGVACTPVFSAQPGGQYVQDAFATSGLQEQLNPATTACVLVGQKPMSEAVVAALTALGVPRERIISNF